MRLWTSSSSTTRMRPDPCVEVPAPDPPCFLRGVPDGPGDVSGDQTAEQDADRGDDRRADQGLRDPSRSLPGEGRRAGPRRRAMPPPVGGPRPDGFRPGGRTRSGAGVGRRGGSGGPVFPHGWRPWGPLPGCSGRVPLHRSLGSSGFRRGWSPPPASGGSRWGVPGGFRIPDLGDRSADEILRGGLSRTTAGDANSIAGGIRVGSSAPALVSRTRDGTPGFSISG